jgi:hypothetical protein
MHSRSLSPRAPRPGSDARVFTAFILISFCLVGIQCSVGNTHFYWVWVRCVLMGMDKILIWGGLIQILPNGSPVRKSK